MFKKYEVTNNARAKLAYSITDTDTTLVIGDGFNLFPSQNFIIKITKKENGIITGRENIYVTNRTGAVCAGLTRAYEFVPLTDAAVNLTKQAISFSAGDVIEIVSSQELIRDIQQAILDTNNVVDMRATAVGTPKSYANKKYLVEFRPQGYGDVGALNIPGAAGGWWTLVTYGSWVDGIYTRQIAYNNGTNNEIWTRNGINNDTWGDWVRIYPISPTGLNIAELPEISNPTSGYDSFLVKEFSGVNKKVTLENLRNWIFNPGAGTTLKTDNYYSTNNNFGPYYSPSVYVGNPTFGLISINENNYAAHYIQYSDNNSNWVDYKQLTAIPNQTILLKKGYWRTKIVQGSTTSGGPTYGNTLIISN